METVVEAVFAAACLGVECEGEAYESEAEAS